jgi:hypothetical protein
MLADLMGEGEEFVDGFLSLGLLFRSFIFTKELKCQKKKVIM